MEENNLLEKELINKIFNMYKMERKTEGKIKNSPLACINPILEKKLQEEKIYGI